METKAITTRKYENEVYADFLSAKDNHAGHVALPTSNHHQQQEIL